MTVLTPLRPSPVIAWGARLAGFGAGFLAGLLLTAVLTVYVWPLVVPLPDVVVPASTGWAAALAMGVVSGTAAVVLVAARQASNRL